VQGATETTAQVINRARHLIEDWSMANVPSVAVHSSSSAMHTTAANTTNSAVSFLGQQHQNLPPISWQQPSRGRVKCNVDASFSDVLNRTGIGLCICDEDGVFILAKSIPVPFLHSVNVGEALGLYYALEWLSDMRFDNVDFALDSKITADAFNHPRPDVTEFPLAEVCLVQSSQTLRLSLLGDKQMR